MALGYPEVINVKSVLFFDATVFSANKDLYINKLNEDGQKRKLWYYEHTDFAIRNNVD